MMLIELFSRTLAANTSGGTHFAALVVPLQELGNVMASTLAFTIFGLMMFALGFWIIQRVAPFSLRKELEEDHNVALAIVIGSVIVGIALIVAAAIQG